jgi:type I restriction enzyme M protein
MVALPAQLFFNTMIPACLWFLARGKTNHKFRDRANEILFIDARKLGTMINRRNKEFSDKDIALIAGTYHAWRNVGTGLVGAGSEPARTEPARTEPARTEPARTEPARTEPAPTEHAPTTPTPARTYADIPGFCKAATLDEVRANNYVLMPGRYVGAEDVEDDGLPFDEKMNALTAKLAEQFARGDELQKVIRENLKGIGYEF